MTDIVFPAPNAVSAARPVPELPSHWTSLASAFVHQVRQNPDKLLVADSNGETVTYKEAFLRAVAIARFIAPRVHNDKFVGIMVPPSAGGLIANIAVMLLGKTAVNLSYAATSDEPNAAIAKCGIKVVITSSKLLEKRGISLDTQCIPLEGMQTSISRAGKLAAWAIASCAPGFALPWFLPGLRCALEDTVTVMFTSGSTGDPKGVELTHGNILHNIAQVEEHGRIDGNDVLLGILPYFHSFGYMATFAAVIAVGVSVVCHHNPLDRRQIIKLIGKHNVTIMLCTPTLMRPYYTRGTAEQFRSVRWLLLGSEKLDPDVAGAIREKLGLEPNEGYGCTELSPVVSGNVQIQVLTPDGRAVAGNRPGTVGQPLPGTLVAILDRETGELISPGSGREGRIFVCGPQVMKGYFKDPGRTAEVLRNGWYFTGDIGFLDGDGFLTITDRENRFAKVGGEMVPIIKVERAIRSIVDSNDVSIAAIPDPAKGERLIVMHTLDEFPIDSVRDQLASSMNPLWIPKANDFHQIESLPVAASGKLDLKALKKLAIELAD